MYARVLLALDGSTLARQAVPHAAKLAGGTGEVVILTVIESGNTLRLRLGAEAYEFGGTALDDLIAGMHARQRAEAEAELEAAKADLEQTEVRGVTPIVREGLPGNVIIDEAQRRDCGAILMATRGHGGLGREVVGSVAEYVLRHAGEAAVVFVGPRADAPRTALP